MFNNQDFYNRLTVSDFLLQMISICLLLADSTNNDLMEELQMQDRKYLEKIIRNQEKILDELAHLKRE